MSQAAISRKKVPVMSDRQQARITDPERATARNLMVTKELIHRRQAVVFDSQVDHERHAVKSAAAWTVEDRRMKIIADVRWWMGRSRNSSRVLCSLWVADSEPGAPYARCMVGGHGSAGGWGYCKQSGAFAAACKDAGIELTIDVHGVGMSSVDHAILAIVTAAGYDPALFPVVIV